MNDQELRAYAVRGLAARLTELDDERAGILALLEQWDTSATPRRRPKERNVVRELDAVESALVPVVVPVSGAAVPSAESEVARVLPRRNRGHADPTTGMTAPALPPMPRLVKARVS